jgi:hypothetical protein
MRPIRLLTMISVVLALPVSGLAAVVHVRTCPAQAVAAGSVAMSVDCCPQQRTDKHNPCEMPDKGSPCNPSKLCHGCNVTQVIDRVELMSLSAVSTIDTGFFSVSTFPVSHGPHGLWRPPRAI